MTLTPAVVDRHIASWQEKLGGPAYPHRKQWPSRLFHHSPLENAISILKSGCIRSRNDPLNARVRDVAAAEVNDARTHAHDFVRLYFRPRTPTQFNIEGIRKTGECKYGDNTHAPVLFMFVLSARKILLSQGVQFSDRNMQIAVAQVGDDEEFFESIPFEKVFHEGGLGGDGSIISHRCAEVLATSPLILQECLQWIYCRSEAERQTLLYMLGKDAKNWSNITRVSDDLRVFDKRYLFAENVSLTRKGVLFQLNPRHDRVRVSIRIQVFDIADVQIASFRNDNMLAVPERHSRWRYECALQPARYKVRMHLEGHLAFESWLTVGDELI